MVLHFSVQVNALPPLGPPINIVPRTTIPLSRSQCNFGVTSHPLDTSATTPATMPTTATHFQHAQTCQALEGIARTSASQCSTVDSCTALDCNFLNLYNAKLTIEPCSNPPALGVVIHDATNDIILEETLINSRTQPINWNGIHIFDLIITITHVQNPDSINLKVSLNTWKPAANWLELTGLSAHQAYSSF